MQKVGKMSNFTLQISSWFPLLLLLSQKKIETQEEIT